MVIKPKRPLPRTHAAWLAEIAAAYRDAAEAIPFGPSAAHPFTEADLFQLGPPVAIKFRGLGRSARVRKRATEAALASYAANEDGHRQTLRNPHLSFAFCYLASHFGLDLLSERQVERLMAYLERNRTILSRLIRGTKPNKRLQPTAPGEIMRRRG